MKDYTFDLTLQACITLQAASEEEARRILEQFADSATMMLQTDDDEVYGEASFRDDPALVDDVDG